MSTTLFGQFRFRFAARRALPPHWRMVLFGSLFAFVRVFPVNLTIGEILSRIMRFVITRVLTVRLVVVRAGLVCRFVVCHDCISLLVE